MEQLEPILLFLSLSVAESVWSELVPEWNPVLELQLEIYDLQRLAFEARAGSSWPESFCFEAPGGSEAVSLQGVVEVKSARGVLVFVCLLASAAGLDIDAFLPSAAAPSVVVPAAAAVVVVVVVFASAPALALFVVAVV